MSKELEYIQRQKEIVEQQVKGSNIKIIVTDTVTKHQYDYYERELQTLESIEQALLELQSIKETNPSEALECLERIGAEKLARGELIRNDDKVETYFNTIKQALLKAQEPKQYVDELKLVEKKLKALEILKQNVKVSIDYGEEKDISMALVFYIDNKKTIYIVDEVIKEQNPEHFKELELLKEVIE